MFYLFFSRKAISHCFVLRTILQTAGPVSRPLSRDGVASIINLPRPKWPIGDGVISSEATPILPVTNDDFVLVFFRKKMDPPGARA